MYNVGATQICVKSLISIYLRCDSNLSQMLKEQIEGLVRVDPVVVRVLSVALGLIRILDTLV
ncbi:hypothetical protein CA13_57500 [Planctomycetes bacterium CA13]|uniref:Uncharacterized protein n=1 Tax=Novipirellula herctigrandis TaxID=2527986 RepID=A0A5C5ZCH1_9BACT|nr:hypothetical protein CA13_57500 [Planctomycetes bacterium CA13]